MVEPIIGASGRQACSPVAQLTARIRDLGKLKSTAARRDMLRLYEQIFLLRTEGQKQAFQHAVDLSYAAKIAVAVADETGQVSDWEKVIKYAVPCIPLCEQHGDYRTIVFVARYEGRARQGIAEKCKSIGDWEKSIAAYTTTLGHMENIAGEKDLDLAAIEAECADKIGTAYLRIGKMMLHRPENKQTFAEAALWCERALVFYRERKYSYAIAVENVKLAEAYYYLERYSECLDLCIEASGIIDAEGPAKNFKVKALLYWALALVPQAQQAGNADSWQKVKEKAEEALELRKKVCRYEFDKDQVDLLSARFMACRNLLSWKKMEACQEAIDAGEALIRAKYQSREVYGVGMDSYRLAELYQRKIKLDFNEMDWERAVRYYRKAWEILSRPTGDRKILLAEIKAGLIFCLHLKIYAGKSSGAGDVEEFLQVVAEVKQAGIEELKPRTRAELLKISGEIRFNYRKTRADVEEARADFEKAYAFFKDQGHLAGKAQICLNGITACRLYIDNEMQ